MKDSTTETTSRQYRILARKNGTKKSYNVTPGGGLNQLKIHAALYNDEFLAELAVKALTVDNPGYSFKVAVY